LNLEIHSQDGVGPIRFKMTRAQVRALPELKLRRSFKRTPAAPTETDAFEGGIFVEYDETDLCEAVEMGAPAAPTLQSRPLVGVAFEDVRKWLAGLDPKLEVDGDGLTSRALGVGVYAPAARKEPNEPTESAIVFRAGYYD
jgi:hypothetical protein